MAEGSEGVLAATSVSAVDSVTDSLSKSSIKSESPNSRVYESEGALHTTRPTIERNSALLDFSLSAGSEYSQDIRPSAATILEIRDGAATSFAYFYAFQLAYITSCVHNEVHSPMSTSRADIVPLLPQLVRRYGNLLLTPSMQYFLQSSLHFVHTPDAGIQCESASFLPNSPGYNFKKDKTGYTRADGSAYFITPPWMLIDWLYANLNMNNAFLQPLPDAPENWPSNPQSRTGILDGLNRAQIGSLQPMFPAGYAAHNAIANGVDSWEYFLLTYPAQQRNIMTTLINQHNRLSTKNFTNCINIRDFLKREDYGSTTNVHNLLSLAVSLPEAPYPEAAAGAGHPDQADCGQRTVSISKYALSVDQISEVSLRQPIFLWDNIASTPDTFYRPDQPDQNDRPEVVTQNLNPIPAWDAAYVGPAYQGQFNGSRVDLDRSLIIRTVFSQE